MGRLSIEEEIEIAYKQNTYSNAFQQPIGYVAVRHIYPMGNLRIYKEKEFQRNQRAAKMRK